MASSKLVKVQGDGDAFWDDSVTETFLVDYGGTPQTNWYTALIGAQSATGSPVPARRTVYATSTYVQLFASQFRGYATTERRDNWYWEVTYTKPPPSELSVYQYSNPLDRPARFDIQYIERDRVIDKARNVLELSHGNGAGGSRAADTDGPIVNAAGKKPDEPQIDTERLEVLVIKKNFASLADIVTRNRTYRRTTNSDTPQGFGARELRYLLTESLGETEENGVVYWPGVTTILADETTDLILDNVGYDYWDVGNARFERAKVTDPDTGDNVFAADPINLKLDGDAGGTTTTTITYRFLEAVGYAGLFV